MKALITGFDPFGGEAVNPAYEIVKSLPDIINNCDIIKKEIPTEFYRSIQILRTTIEEIQPDIVICIGQAGNEAAIRVERVAINMNEARIPDNVGAQPSDEVIASEGENAYFSNLPVKAILQSLHRNNIPANLSYTAGTYVCNHLFYGLMHTIKNDHPSIRGGFIHVPYLPEQVVGKASSPSMSLSMMSNAIEIAIASTIEHEEDIQLQTGTTH